jgi:SNF2 family DNA or RNA helicase
MTPELILVSTRTGKPHRFGIINSGRLVHKIMAMGGGTCNLTQRGMITFPLDPLIINNIRANVPELTLDAATRTYLSAQYRRRLEIDLSCAMEAPLFDNDRLRGYQRASVRFLTSAKRALLAHDMGTGKTVIVSTAIKAENLIRVLIVCPNTIKWSWGEHLIEWANWHEPIILEAQKINSARGIKVLHGKNADETALRIAQTLSSTPCALIMNFQQARKHHAILKTFDFDVIVVDEAHRIKNRKSLQSIAIRRLTQMTHYLWLLTGTPIRNDYSDMWAYLNAIDPERFGSFWNYVNYYLDTAPNYLGVMDVVGIKNEATYNAMLGDYVFRRTKEEVMPDLPEKIYTPIPIPLRGAQKVAYHKMQKEFLLEIEQDPGIVFAPNVVAKLIRLRQICLDPRLIGKTANSEKLEALQDLIEDFRLSEEKFIVYTCFKEFAKTISTLLAENVISHGMITGDESGATRHEAVYNLTQGKTQAIVGTIQSMGEGLNIQAATTAVFMDIDWVPAVNEQAEDRLHRRGIQQSPRMIHIYHPDTVEEDIINVCQRKQEIENNSIGSIETMRAMNRRLRSQS